MPKHPELHHRPRRSLWKPPIKITHPAKRRPATLIYSKSNRRQLLNSDMAHTIIFIYKDLLSQPEQHVLNIIDSCSTCIKTIQTKLYGGQKLVLKNSDLDRYKKTIKQIQNSVDKVLGTDPRLSLDFISGILALITDQCDEIHKYIADPAYRKAWSDLVLNLQTLYENYDSDMEYTSVQENGAELADKIQEIIKTS